MSTGIRAFVVLLAVVASTLTVVPVVDAGPTLVVVDVEAGATSTPARRVPVGRVVRAEVPGGTDAVGFTWTGPEARISVRSLGPSGWTGWVTVEDEADHGDAVPNKRAATRGAGPVWTGPSTRAVEVLVDAATPIDLAVHATGPADDDPLGDDPAGDDPTDLPGRAPAIPALGAAGTERAVRPASAWSSPGWSYRNCPGGAAASRPVDAIVVHHTATTTAYTASQVDDMLRSIHRFHTRTRGWCDIAYQFLVDRFGTIWEGRTGGIALPVLGGHARGFNTATTGIALLGDFDANSLSGAAADSVALVAAWKAAANDFDPGGRVERTSAGSTSIPAGRRVVIDRISGHRDVASSTCPGRHAYGDLAGIRSSARTALDVPGGFFFGGRAGDVALAGNWTGRGPGVGVHRAGAFHLRNDLSGGGDDTVVRLGIPGDRPVFGDWNGDGIDTVGVERRGEFHLLDRNQTPDPLGLLSGDRTLRPAVPADFALDRAVPVAGDWNGDGIDTVGYMADGDVVLFADADAERIERRVTLGRSGDVPVTGDWDGDGADDVGLRRDGVLYVPRPGDPVALRAVHRIPDGHVPFLVDWTGRGLSTLLTATARGFWDPTTPIGL